jgi:hypothetical protein
MLPPDSRRRESLYGDTESVALLFATETDLVRALAREVRRFTPRMRGPAFGLCGFGRRCSDLWIIGALRTATWRLHLRVRILAARHNAGRNAIVPYSLWPAGINGRFYRCWLPIPVTMER